MLTNSPLSRFISCSLSQSSTVPGILETGAESVSSFDFAFSKASTVEKSTCNAFGFETGHVTPCNACRVSTA